MSILQVCCDSLSRVGWDKINPNVFLKNRSNGIYNSLTLYQREMPLIGSIEEVRGKQWEKRSKVKSKEAYLNIDKGNILNTECKYAAQTKMRSSIHPFLLRTKTFTN